MRYGGLKSKVKKLYPLYDRKRILFKNETALALACCQTLILFCGSPSILRIHQKGNQQDHCLKGFTVAEEFYQEQSSPKWPQILFKKGTFCMWITDWSDESWTFLTIKISMSLCIIGVSILILFHFSQVDFNTKAWICNFCFQRNAVS